MKKVAFLILAFANASVFAHPTAPDTAMRMGATLKQSGDNCLVSLQYLEMERSTGISAPVVKGIEVNTKCTQLLDAGVITNENDKLVFTGRARAMAPSELSAALARLPN